MYTQSDSTTQVNPTTQIQSDDSIQFNPIPTIDCVGDILIYKIYKTYKIYKIIIMEL